MATIHFSNESKSSEGFDKRSLIRKTDAMRIVRKAWTKKVKEHRKEVLRYRVAVALLVVLAIVGWVV